MPESYKARVIRSLAEVDGGSWNRLTDGRIPYLRHEFLYALEKHGCIGGSVGWFSFHLLVESADGSELLTALPMYLKTNSFGEFVFDWAWASAYERAELQYYPKLVVAPPFTPATGPRVLLRDDAPSELFKVALDTALRVVDQNKLSSLHVLFAAERRWSDDAAVLLPRMGCQFHWQNRGYRDFDDFLDGFTAKRRKEVKRERRQVENAGVTLRMVPGNQATAVEIETFYRLYQSTFDRYGNHAALTLPFFAEIAATLGDAVVYVLAERDEHIIAGAYLLAGADTLYGRYWGAFEEVPSLHFEACYYQGIEYCIKHGLRWFEPGAQGEHKVSRGFLPTATWSYHWIAHSGFRNSIARFLQEEQKHMEAYMASMNAHSPYKNLAE